MADIIEDIVKINVTVQSQGLGNVNFGIPCFFVLKSELKDGAVFADNTMINIAKLDDVATYFEATTESYRMAARWFAANGVAGFMYLRADATDPVADGNNAKEQNFFYHAFFTKDTFADHDKALLLADWADASMAYLWVGVDEATSYDNQVETSLLAKLYAKGNRHVSVAPRLATTIATDGSQIYAINGAAALFSRVNYQGLKTAITAEHKSVTGAIGEVLTNTQYKALRERKAFMFTRIEVADQVDQSVCINSWSMSSSGEFSDDASILTLSLLHCKLPHIIYSGA